MGWSFTAAAERALAEAAAWTCHDDRNDLDPPELLLGLLSEPESRAADMLRAQGVDVSTVRARWPSLRRRATVGPREFGPELVLALDEAVGRLWEYPRPLLLATEHLLLGLTAGPGDVSRWLCERGLEPDRLEARIHQLYGHEPGALPIDVPVEEVFAPTAHDVAAVDVPDDLAANKSTSDKLAAAEIANPSSVTQRPAEQSPHGFEPSSHSRTMLPCPSASGSVPLLRLIDAASNRAREALRVVEDYVRLAFDDRYLTSELKQLRHGLRAALSGFSPAELLASRETLTDVGATISTAAEYARTDLTAVAVANWKRLQEALRSLEEFTKIADARAAAAIERLRYRSYTLERAAETTRAGLTRLGGVPLCVLVDGRANADEFVQLVDALLAGGATMLQLRDKRLADRDLLARAALLQSRTARVGAVCIINDRADIAAAVRADGVHVGQDDLPIKAARAIVGPQAIVGTSTHSLEQARQAVLDGANYIGVGPTFHSRTKEFAAFTGVELLRAVSAEIRLPTFAIGGINLDNLPEVTAAGMSRIAVSGAIVAAAEPQAAAARFVARLNGRTFERVPPS